MRLKLIIHNMMLKTGILVKMMFYKMMGENGHHGDDKMESVVVHNDEQKSGGDDNIIHVPQDEDTHVPVDANNYQRYSVGNN